MNKGEIKMKKTLSVILSLLITVNLFALSGFAAKMPIEMLTVQSGNVSEFGYISRTLVDGSGNEVTENDSFAPNGDVLKTMSAIPSSYDSRSANCITEVKNQGLSGNCWAFSSLSLLESDSILQGIDSMDSADYSEAHLSWFTANSLTDDTSDPTYGDGTTSDTPFVTGGNWAYAAASLARWSGAAEDNLYPFYPYDLSAMGGYTEDERYDTSSGIILKSAEIITNSDEVKQWIIDHGSVSVAMYYSDDYLNSSTASYYFNGSTTINHQVTVIGWDDSYSANNFRADCVPSANGAWLCKNSWGTYWGNGGYFWISYYDTALQDFAGFTSQSVEGYHKNYTYNGAVWQSAIKVGGAPQVANVFKSDTCEKLTSIAVHTVEAATDLSIRIFKDIAADYSSPVDGTLAASIGSYHISRSGYHTIELPEEIYLEPGSFFSVVIEFSNSSGTVCVPVEADGQTSTAYVSREKESYINLSSNDSGWEESSVYGINNMYIQAFSKVCHTPKTEILHDSCEREGTETTACTVCGKMMSQTVIPAGSHSFSEWSKYEKDPETGRMASERSCPVCGDVQRRSYISGSNVVTLDELFEIIRRYMIEFFKLFF